MSVAGDPLSHPQMFNSVQPAHNPNETLRSIIRLNQLPIITKNASSSSSSSSCSSSSSPRSTGSVSSTIEKSSNPLSSRLVRDSLFNSKRANGPSPKETHPAGQNKRQKLVRSCKTQSVSFSQLTKGSEIVSESEDEAQPPEKPPVQRLAIKRPQAQKSPPPIPDGIILLSEQPDSVSTYNPQKHFKLNPDTPWIQSSFNPSLSSRRFDTLTCIRPKYNLFSVSISTDTPSDFSKPGSRPGNLKPQSALNAHSVRVAEDSNKKSKKVSNEALQSTSPSASSSSSTFSTFSPSSSSPSSSSSTPPPLKVSSSSSKIVNPTETPLGVEKASSPITNLDPAWIELRRSEEQNKWWHWAKNCKHTGDLNKSAHLTPLRCKDLIYSDNEIEIVQNSNNHHRSPPKIDESNEDSNHKVRSDEPSALPTITTNGVCHSVDQDARSEQPASQPSSSKTPLTISNNDQYDDDKKYCSQKKIFTRKFCPNAFEYQKFFCSDPNYSSLSSILKKKDKSRTNVEDEEGREKQGTKDLNNNKVDDGRAAVVKENGDILRDGSSKSLSNSNDENREKSIVSEEGPEERKVKGNDETSKDKVVERSLIMNSKNSDNDKQERRENACSKPLDNDRKKETLKSGDGHDYENEEVEEEEDYESENLKKLKKRVVFIDEIDSKRNSRSYHKKNKSYLNDLKSSGDPNNGKTKTHEKKKRKRR